MLLASVQNVTKLYVEQAVLQGVSFGISSGQKLGLIGPNGSGKTTLLRILLGYETATEGAAFVAKGARVGYVPQYVEHNDGHTVLGCILAEHARLTADLREREERLAHAPGSAMAKALRAYERAREAYDRVDGDHFPSRAKAMLDALGLAGKGDQAIGSLSGGEKNVLSLAQALLAEPELLILDEPGNHLDYLGIAWLEDFFARFKGAILLVSHNRYLLDRVADGILQLQDGRVKYYAGGYSTYRATRLRELVAQQADYAANQKRLAQLEALVRRLADIAAGSADPAAGRRLRARRSQLARERKQGVEKPVLDESSIRADFSTEATRANVALQLRGYSKRFGDRVLFDLATLDVACGERVALIGPNGCGKTTLLRDIVQHGAWEHATIRIGPSLRVGYGSQEQEDLHPEFAVHDEILSAAPMSRKQAYGLMARFLFGPDDFGKRVADLSGGERNRLQLARFMVTKPNFLILDEPTNHLDIPAREAVEEALAEFEGTLLVVSHDRYFLDKIATRVVEVRDRQLVSYAGNFSEFWRARQEAMPRAVGRISKRSKGRERHAETTRGNALASLEKRIADCEERKLELERCVADAFQRRDHREGRRASNELERVKKRLDVLYEKWMARAE